MSKLLARKTQFYHQLQAGYRAGLPMEVLVQGAALPQGKPGDSERLQADVQRGKSLSSALLARKLITPWEARLLGIGEANGRLEVVLQELELFFEARQQQARDTRVNLLYPMMVLLVAIFVPPLPALARGDITTLQYLAGSGIKSLLLYLGYRWLFIRPFETASAGAFNPLLLKSLRFVNPGHWLREAFEVSLLNLLSLCLESGMDAAQSLRLLRDANTHKGLRVQLQSALRSIESHGTSLCVALAGAELIQHPQILGFLDSSEQSGTLHSDLRQYLARKNADVRVEINYQIKRMNRWVFIVILLYVASRLLLVQAFMPHA